MDWSETIWSGENKLHHKARVHETICDRSFFILDCMCFCYITGMAIVYSVDEHDFESPSCLCDVNRGNSYVSLAIF